MSRRILGILGAILLLSGAGCATTAPSAQTVVVLFDLSTSARAQHDAYLKTFNERILPALHEGDTLVVDRISDKPLAQAEFPVNVTFKRYGPFDPESNKLRREVAEKEQQEAIKKAVLEMVNSGNAEATAIMDSTMVAERVFNNYPNETKKLVIFSDMIESSSSQNFDRTSLTPQATTAIIAQRQRDGQLPALTGVTVTVVGAGVDSTKAATSKKWLSIRDFWIAYFRDAGADLNPSRYGSAILAF